MFYYLVENDHWGLLFVEKQSRQTGCSDSEVKWETSPALSQEKGVCVKLLQWCPTVCDSVDCSPPCSSVRGILQGGNRRCCHLMRRTDSFEKTLMLGKTEGERRRGQQKKWLYNITDSMNMNWSKLWETMGDSGAWWATVLGGCKALDTT